MSKDTLLIYISYFTKYKDISHRRQKGEVVGKQEIGLPNPGGRNQLIIFCLKLWEPWHDSESYSVYNHSLHTGWLSWITWCRWEWLSRDGGHIRRLIWNNWQWFNGIVTSCSRHRMHESFSTMYKLRVWERCSLWFT